LPWIFDILNRSEVIGHQKRPFLARFKDNARK